MKKTFLLLVLTLGASSLLGGCAKAPDDMGKTILKVVTWDNARMMPVLEGLAKDYEKIHPKVAVKIRRIPYNEYLDRLTASQPASLLPDVMLVSTGQAAELFARSMLAPLGKPDPRLGYDPGLVKMFSFQNRLYALPRDLAPVCLVYYNKALFDSAHQAYPKEDWDWKKFLQTAGALGTPENPQNKKRVWGFVEDWPMVEPWVYGEGGRWVDDGVKPQKYAVIAKGFLAGIRFQDHLIHKYKVAPSPQDFVAEGQIGGVDLFVQGQAAMYLSGPWKGVEFNGNQKLKWGVVMIPRGPRGVRAFQVGGSGWGLLASSANPKAASDLVAFLSSIHAQDRITRAGLALPASLGIEAELDGLLNPALAEASRALIQGKGIEDPRACNWPDIRENHINPVLERVWSGELTPEKAVALLQKDLAGNPPSMKPPERKPPAQNKPAMFLF